MTTPFARDFSTTILQSGMFVMSSACSFNITPEARTAKIDAWRTQQVAEIDTFYLQAE